MKRTQVFALSLVVLVSAGTQSARTQSSPLAQAEDLWGNPVNLDSLVQSDRPTVIVPFSTSICGYCLFDGFYAEPNYLDQNDAFGGNSFHWCLFNPQLDVVAFQKHYGWTHTILTYPPKLFLYQRTGYPDVLAFRSGKQVIREWHDYARLDSLGRLLWQGKSQMIPRGPIHMGTRLLFDNGRLDAVRVYPTGVEIPEQSFRAMRRHHSLVPKNLDQLTEADLHKHLFFSGDFPFEELAGILGGENMPVRFEGGQVKIGPYSLDYDSTGIRFLCPNPFNQHRYLLVIVPHGTRSPGYFHFLDYEFLQASRDTSRRVLYGHFDEKHPSDWKFSPEKAFGLLANADTCGDRCPAPSLPAGPPPGPVSVPVAVETSPSGTLYRFGSGSCHFPDVVTDSTGNVWLAWDAGGDVYLARVAKGGQVTTWKAEADSSDSYNARLTCVPGGVWIFYLNNRSSYYRLYGRLFDGKRFSDELLVSPSEPYDVVSPAAVGSPAENRVTVVWSAWLANLRVPGYREIVSGRLGPVRQVRLHDSIYSKGYLNGWAFSLCRDASGRTWAAWNQHYPATLGVFAGPLDEPPQAVTRRGKRSSDWEIGGYPCIFAGKGRLFAVWESDARRVAVGWSQTIRFASYDSARGRWNAGQVVSDEAQTQLAQTPVGAVAPDGALWVAYSGRSLKERSHWGIYVTCRRKQRWSSPRLVSRPDSHARAPRLAVGSPGNIWLAWHEGTGDGMKIALLRLGAGTFGTER